MTTSGRVLLAKDVFVENEVFLLSRGRYPNTSAQGGIAWLRREPPTAAHLNALNAAVAAVERCLPTYHLWLLGAHTVAQPDSAITRHRRLWKSLETRGVSAPPGTRSEEVAVIAPEGTRWFGARSIESLNLAEAANVIEAEAASVVVAVPTDADHTVGDVLSRGWTSSNQGPPPEIVDWLGSHAGIAFWPVGAFDDVESGVVAFSRPDIIDLLEVASA